VKIHDTPQGSLEWLRLRAEFNTASEAAAMLGVSKYQTRADLIRQKATGVAAEVSEQKQHLFNRGHEAEAGARAIAEEIIGEELYPVTASADIDGLSLLASLDGMTLAGDVIWEHKLWNASLAEAVRAGNLDPHYTVQMDQQLLVTKAKRCLFMTSDGTRDRAAWFWYEPKPEKASALVEGWKVFNQDVRAYRPTEAAAPVVAVVETLPAVSVRMDGALTVQSNLPAFGEALRQFVSKIPAKPSTDQEFADTDAACKALKRAEDALEAAESNALASMSDVEAMRRMVSEFRSIARTARLASEKMVEARKRQIREEEVKRGHDAMREHIGAIHADLGGSFVLSLKRGDFASAIKGLKTLDSLRNAIDTEIAAAKIEANEIAARIRTNLACINGAGNPGLFADRASLVLQDPGMVSAVVSQRVAQHAAEQERRLEAERQRIRAEEEARAKREAQEAAERAARAEREAAKIEQAKAAQAAQPAAQMPVAQREVAGNLPQSEPVLVREPSDPTAARPVEEGDCTRPMTPPAQCVTRAEEPATINGGHIANRLGFTLQASFIAEVLGVPWRATDKAAKLWAESDFERIKTALIQHIKEAA
jgi:putative phage-type endonuclease